MSRILVSTAELNLALRALRVITLDDAQYVDGLELTRAILALAGGELPSLAPGSAELLLELKPAPPARPGAVAWAPSDSADEPTEHEKALYYAEFGVLEDDGSVGDPIEAERKRLAALPPGPCWGCDHVHPDESPCIECEPPGCEDYVDKTNRDPIESLGAQGLLPEGEEPIQVNLGMPPGDDFNPRRIISDRFAG